MNKDLTYKIQINLKDAVSNAISKIKNEFTQLGKKTEDAQQKVDCFGIYVNKSGKSSRINSKICYIVQVPVDE